MLRRSPCLPSASNVGMVEACGDAPVFPVTSIGAGVGAGLVTGSVAGADGGDAAVTGSAAGLVIGSAAGAGVGDSVRCFLLCDASSSASTDRFRDSEAGVSVGVVTIAAGHSSIAVSSRGIIEFLVG